MEIKHKDLVIDKDEPFTNCQLGREHNARILTKIVESYADGFVLTINNKWGTGKTTFIKMWQQYLDNNGFKTMYFNAWENDFEMEPFAAMLGELKKIIGKNGEIKSYDSLIKKGAVVVKRILPSIAKFLAKKYLGEEAVDLVSDSAEAATDILKDEVEDYIKRKEHLIEFKKELVDFVNKNRNDKPVVFIIDELDRCRPDYAVEILEKVKHFFSVPGIVFVLSMDKEQLGYAIQGYYGSGQIDTEEYLRRFIDIEYQLPSPDIGSFAQYLFNYFGFKDFFSKENRPNSDIQYERDDFVDISILLGETFQYTLRQFEKLYAYTRIVLRTFSPTVEIKPKIILFLVHLKLFNSSFYDDIRDKKLSIQDLINNYEELFKLNAYDDNYNNIVMTEAFLLCLYNNYYQDDENRYGAKKPLLTEAEGEDNVYVLTYSTKTKDMVKLYGKFSLEVALRDIQRRFPYLYRLSIHHYLNKIEIIDDLISN